MIGYSVLRLRADNLLPGQGVNYVLSCVFLILTTADVAAQPVKAHMEACTQWGYAGGEFGTRNSCDAPLTMRFMALGDQRVIESEVPPGAWFGSGADISHGWIFTACPLGYAPSVRFAMDNKDVIMVSLYNCLPTRPEASSSAPPRHLATAVPTCSGNVRCWV